MRLGFVVCFTAACVSFASVVHAQAAPETTTVVATPRTSMEALQYALNASREYEDGMIVAFTGLGLFLAGAVMIPLALLSPLFAPDAHDPLLGAAIGLGSVGLVLDIVGVIMMFDAIAHLPPIDEGHYPM